MVKDRQLVNAQYEYNENGLQTLFYQVKKLFIQNQ